jgi:hypothetical protein
MRKVLMLAALVAAAASFLVIGTGSASADGAVVDISQGCVFLDVDGVSVFFDADARRQTVTTPSGGALTTCNGTYPGTPPDTAVVQSGFTCFTTVGLTTDSHEVITPSGKVILSCHNNV